MTSNKAKVIFKKGSKGKEKEKQWDLCVFVCACLYEKRERHLQKAQITK